MNTATIGVVLAGVAGQQQAEVTEALEAELKKRATGAVCIVAGVSAGATAQETARAVLDSLEKSGVIPAASAQEPVYTKEEEAKIRKRLEDLGYL